MAICESESNIKRGKSSKTSLQVTSKINKKETHPVEFDCQVREELPQLPIQWPKRKRSRRKFMKLHPSSYSSSSSSSSSDISPGWSQDIVIPVVMKGKCGRPPKNAYNNNDNTSLPASFSIIKKQISAKLYDPPSDDSDQPIREELFPGWTKKSERRKRGRPRKFSSSTSNTTSSSSSSDCSSNNSLAWHVDDIVIPGKIPDLDDFKKHFDDLDCTSDDIDGTSLLASCSILKKQRSAKLYSPPSDSDQQIREEIFSGWTTKSERRKRGRPRKFSSSTSSTTSSSSSSDCLSNNSIAWHVDDIVIPGPIPDLDEIIKDSSLFVNFFSDIPETVN